MFIDFVTPAGLQATAQKLNGNLNTVTNRLPVYAADYGFAAGNTGAQNKMALQAALSICYTQNRFSLILPDAPATAPIDVASGIRLSSMIAISAHGSCFLNPSDNDDFLFRVLRPTTLGLPDRTGVTIGGAWCSDEMATGTSGGMRNLKFRNSNTAKRTGQAVYVGDDDAGFTGAASQGIGYNISHCHFGGLQSGLFIGNNVWSFTVDNCDFSTNDKHFRDDGSQNKGENMRVLKSSFHDSPTPYSIEFAGHINGGGAADWKFENCSIDYNVQPLAFSGSGYQVEMKSCWLEWNPSQQNQQIVVSATADNVNNTLMMTGGAVVMTGSTGRMAGNSMAGHLMIVTDMTQYRITADGVQHTGAQIIYVDPNKTNCYVRVPFAHADAGVPTVIPLNNPGGAWWIEAPTDDNTDHFSITLENPAGAQGAKFLVRA